jgi:hypothetical protein
MELPQHFDKQKCHFFFFFSFSSSSSSYFLFFFYKIGEQEGKTGPAWGEGGWYQWEEEDVGKGCKRVNMVQILCAHVRKWKNGI